MALFSKVPWVAILLNILYKLSAIKLQEIETGEKFKLNDAYIKMITFNNNKGEKIRIISCKT